MRTPDLDHVHDRPPGSPGPTPAALAALFTPPPATRDENIERGVATFRMIGSPGFPFDEARRFAIARRAPSIGISPAGHRAAIMAILASGSRADALASLRVPALVIHGDADPLVSVEAGTRHGSSASRARSC